MTKTCPLCGLVDDGHCGSAEDAEGCPHAPGAVVQDGPLTGLRKWHYGLIEADPPWSFKTYSNRDRGTVPHRAEEEPYRAMTAEELLALPVDEIAAKDCVLHMWTISSHLDQALGLGRAWGFTYKSLGFNWVKTQKHDPEKPKMGMGKWLRQDSEIGLIFTKGKPKRQSAAVRQTILEPAREHSRKPDCRLERLEQLADGPYLEMFSRSSRPGWAAMGDEVGKFDKKGIDFGDPYFELDEEAMELI